MTYINTNNMNNRTFEEIPEENRPKVRKELLKIYTFNIKKDFFV